MPDDARRARFAADLAAVVGQAGLEVGAPLGVAVSGGPDSLALLILAATSAAGRIRAMTVDHGLRPGSAAEAADVASLCASLDVPHAIARVDVADRSGGAQAAARRARYAALAGWAARDGLAAVLTAHHADDQAETVLMRLARGSGIAGLAGIRTAQRIAAGGREVWALRPLLRWRRAELGAICAAAGARPARDPSNADDRFDRTAARALLARTPWLDPARLAAVAAHAAEADAALASIAGERHAVTRRGDEVRLAPDPSREIARRQLRRLLADAFDARPDGPSLERTLSALVAGGAATCADVLCRAAGDRWSFRRAPPRVARPPARAADRSRRPALFHCD